MAGEHQTAHPAFHLGERAGRGHGRAPRGPFHRARDHDVGRARGQTEVLQVARHRVRIRGTILGRLGQRLHDQGGQLLGDVGTQVLDGQRIVHDDVGEHHDDVVGPECLVAGEAFVEHAANGPHIGGRTDLALGARLLGRHVEGRADQAARLAALARGVVLDRAEIDELDVLDGAAGKEQVGGLDVAVHEAALVQLGHGRGQPPPDLERLREREPRGRGLGRRGRLLEHARALLAIDPLEVLGQGLALQPLHHQVGRIAAHDAVRDVADDPRMPDLGQHARLLEEAIARPGIAIAQHLDGNGLAGLEIAGAEDATHAAGGDLQLDLEAMVDGVTSAHLVHDPTTPKARG
jgi:hypothetical protein